MGSGKHYHTHAVGQGQFLGTISAGLALHHLARCGQALDQGTTGGLVNIRNSLCFHTSLHGKQQAVGRRLGVALLLGVHSQDNKILQVAGEHLGIQGIHLVQSDSGQYLLVGCHLGFQ